MKREVNMFTRRLSVAAAAAAAVVWSGPKNTDVWHKYKRKRRKKKKM